MIVEKIITECRKCEKYTKLSIVDPIEFHVHLPDRILTLDELSSMSWVDIEHYQWFLVEQYLFGAGRIPIDPASEV